MTTLTRARRADKAAQAWHDSLVYKVTGSGYFPLDMLRYDQAYPADSESATALGHLEFGVARTVALRSLKPPTVGRWQSFGWKVECECTMSSRCAQHLS